MSTIFKELAENAAFAEQYARACEMRADAQLEELLEIADDGRNDWMQRHAGEDVGWAVNGEHIQRSRLRVDARKWAMAKMAPKKYGDRVTNEVVGKDGGPIEIRAEADDARGKLAIALAKSANLAR